MTKKSSFLSKFFKKLFLTKKLRDLNFNELAEDATKKYEIWNDINYNSQKTLDVSNYGNDLEKYVEDFKVKCLNSIYAPTIRGNKVYKNPLKEQFYASYGLTLDQKEKLKSILKEINKYRENLVGNSDTNINPNIYKNSKHLYNFVVPVIHTGKAGLDKRIEIDKFFGLKPSKLLGTKERPNNVRSHSVDIYPLSYSDSTSSAAEEFTEHPYDFFITNNSKYLREYLKKIKDKDSFFRDIKSLKEADELDLYSRRIQEASVAFSPLARYYRKQNNDTKTIGKNIINLLALKDDTSYVKEIDKILNNVYPQKYYSSGATDSIKNQLLHLKNYFNILKNKKNPMYKKYLKELEKVTPGF
jgi:hypothetical protein